MLIKKRNLMKRLLIVGLSLFFIFPIFAGTNDVIELQHMVVTATATDKQIMQVPYLMDVVTSEDIQNDNMSQTIPDALQYIPGVMVQKTAAGHGSPYIRGFTSRNNQ